MTSLERVARGSLSRLPTFGPLGRGLQALLAGLSAFRRSELAGAAPSPPTSLRPTVRPARHFPVDAIPPGDVNRLALQASGHTESWRYAAEFTRLLSEMGDARDIPLHLRHGLLLLEDIAEPPTFETEGKAQLGIARVEDGERRHLLLQLEADRVVVFVTFPSSAGRAAGTYPCLLVRGKC